MSSDRYLDQRRPLIMFPWKTPLVLLAALLLAVATLAAVGLVERAASPPVEAVPPGRLQHRLHLHLHPRVQLRFSMRRRRHGQRAANQRRPGQRLLPPLSSVADELRHRLIHLRQPDPRRIATCELRAAATAPPRAWRAAA